MITRTLLRALCCPALLLVGLGSCVVEVEVPEEVEPTTIEVNETRTVTLRFARLDVEDFPLSIALADLEKMPEETLRNTWLLDLDARPLINNALNILVSTPDEELVNLGQAEFNMVKLLHLTSHSASTALAGTSMEPLIDLGETVDIKTSTILADLLQVEPNERLISPALMTDVVLNDLLATHPNTQWRPGPVDDDHPDGRYPVPVGYLPVTLYDVIDGFADLPIRFGPHAASGHPGFVSSTSGIQATTSEFGMTVKANINAMPYESVDLTLGSTHYLNSLGSQINVAFDFSDPDWMVVDGLVDELVIAEMTMKITESDEFWAGGTSRDPEPLGDSPVWSEVPAWEFEHIIMNVAVERAKSITAHETSYAPPVGSLDPDVPPDTFEAVRVSIDEGAWIEIEVNEDAINTAPPTKPLDELIPPAKYFWDLLIEIAQVRLHDGLGEGKADVELTLRDIPTGISTEALIDTMKQNVMTDASSLVDFAALLNDTSVGDPDFYYYRPRLENPEELQGDYLYFVTPMDIRNDDAGAKTREYSSYEQPGFYADAELTSKVSTRQLIDDDDSHEKVKIEEGDVLYVKDDEGRRFKIEVGPKPERNEIALDVTRLD